MTKVGWTRRSALRMVKCYMRDHVCSTNDKHTSGIYFWTLHELKLQWQLRETIVMQTCYFPPLIYSHFPLNKSPLCMPVHTLATLQYFSPVSYALSQQLIALPLNHCTKFAKLWHGGNIQCRNELSGVPMWGQQVLLISFLISTLMLNNQMSDKLCQCKFFLDPLSFDKIPCKPILKILR